MSDVWPSKLTFQKSAAQLNIQFDDGSNVSIPYLVLRQESPSADVQGHGSGPRPPQAPVPADISVTKAEPVGRYAIRIYFSDGHSSGLFTWAYLRGLAA